MVLVTTEKYRDQLLTNDLHTACALLCLADFTLVRIVALHLDLVPFNLGALIYTFKTETKTFLGCTLLIDVGLIYCFCVWVRDIEAATGFFYGEAVLVYHGHQVVTLTIC